MKIKDIINEEFLAEEEYTVAIADLPSVQNLLTRKDVKERIDFIVNEWEKTKKNYGVSTIKELIEKEIQVFPRCSIAYKNVKDKESFWKKVEYFDSLVKEK